jgi:hypothetical protein
VRAGDLAADGAAAAVRDQSSDPRPNRRDLLDDLLDRLDVRHRAAAARAAGRGDVDVLVDSIGDDAALASMPLGPSRPLPAALGDLQRLAPPERRRLPRPLPHRLVELVAKLAVLGFQQPDLLLQLDDPSREIPRRGCWIGRFHG